MCTMILLTEPPLLLAFSAACQGNCVDTCIHRLAQCYENEKLPPPSLLVHPFHVYCTQVLAEYIPLGHPRHQIPI